MSPGSIVRYGGASCPRSQQRFAATGWVAWLRLLGHVLHPSEDMPTEDGGYATRRQQRFALTTHAVDARAFVGERSHPSTQEEWGTVYTVLCSEDGAIPCAKTGVAWAARNDLIGGRVFSLSLRSSTGHCAVILALERLSGVHTPIGIRRPQCRIISDANAFFRFTPTA